MREALQSGEPPFDAAIVDSYKYAASVVSRVVSSGYIGMVKTLPQMYRLLYNQAERAKEVGPFRTWIHQFTAANLRELMREYRPDVVICTHAFPCGVMAEYKRQFADAPPVVGIVTDFVVHSFWIHDNIDGYAVATPEMRAALIARGVREGRILVSGIPVRAAFGEPSPDRHALRERLGLPPDRSILLLMGGGLGIGRLERIVEALDGMSMPICTVAIVGRSRRSETRVLDCAHRVRNPVRVLRFVDNVHEYMHASDVLITKPGGLTSAEALAAGVPMVLFKPLPGQEERNTRYLVTRHAAVRARRYTDLAKTVERLLRSDRKLGEMRAVMKEIGRPNAAAHIAALIRELVANRKEEAIA